MNDYAVFTIVRNEKKYLPIFMKYYSRFFDSKDIYILDNDTEDGSTDNLAVQVEKIHNPLYFSHQWLVDNVQRKQRELLQKYRYVLFVECDEMVVPNPTKFANIAEYMACAKLPLHRCSGFEIIQAASEAPLDWDKPILDQRHTYCPSPGFSKPLMARKPMTWVWGFHNGTYQDQPPTGEVYPDPDLLLMHLHFVDYAYHLERHEWKAKQQWKNDGGAGFHNRWTPDECIANYTALRAGSVPIPPQYTGAIL